MKFPERFQNLPEYAFPRLRALLDVHEPARDPIAMTIGEPRHSFPDWVGQVLAENIDGFAKYPPNDGSPELRQAITDWIKRRYSVDLDHDTQVMALNGTREGLYNAAMALCPEMKSGQKPVILMPNPFYQVYAVATLAVAADPVYVPATAETGHLPDFTTVPNGILNRTALVYICSPANPQGAVADCDYWKSLITLAEKYDFKILADECYSEIYRDTPPVGALQVAAEMGADPERVVIFHSLSKRSNLPGLRSGFVASGAENIRHIKQLRNYAGAPLPLPLQQVAANVWADEAHVDQNRALYRDKYQAADEIFAETTGYAPPQAGFFLWLPVEDGEATALKLWRETGVRVLPGAYLSRDVGGQNPGAGYIRVAMVAPMNEMQDGLIRLRDCIYR
ncbi:aminotransferase class I/II-fold pyridoxal phosphate-dependent enzyme [Pseudaestuariivita rosea]|uniref:aminotransferase class I/II-fold pyridoxal phosphate-dependent enzyme n=1 Tax=Pseudaestuariivita rosea TaxID=2763263 RepID=UPI001ABB3840|nr:aminotransferase class I/II-fold pyridoxal phosphate-dependent enzyme [Pseudaestuariivita rosea]